MADFTSIESDFSWALNGAPNDAPAVWNYLALILYAPSVQSATMALVAKAVGGVVSYELSCSDSSGSTGPVAKTASGVARIELTYVGGDPTAWELDFLWNDVSQRTSSFAATGGAARAWVITYGAYESAGNGFIGSHLYTNLTDADGGSISFPWDAFSELEAWRKVAGTVDPLISGGALTIADPATYYPQDFSHVLEIPRIGPHSFWRSQAKGFGL